MAQLKFPKILPASYIEILFDLKASYSLHVLIMSAILFSVIEMDMGTE
jgi:hypothetical protein